MAKGKKLTKLFHHLLLPGTSAIAKTEEGPVAYDTTIKLMKAAGKFAPRKRAKMAVRTIKRMAVKLLNCKAIKIDNKLNEAVWARGVKFLPHRVRVRFSRKRDESDNATEPFYVLCEVVEVPTFKGLGMEKVVEN